MESVFIDISLVIIISSLLSWLAVITRQPIIVAYILSGIILGPFGSFYVHSIAFIDQVSEFGVVMLLFLAGLVLPPRKLSELFRQTFFITIGSAAVFCVLAACVTYFFGFSLIECVITGMALMFSSTILVVKLLPTTTLHQQRLGSLCIAILIVQDLLAVTALLFLKGSGPGSWAETALIPVKGLVFIITVFLAEQYLVRTVMRKVEYYHEALFLIALAWCFASALVAQKIGFSYEIGAFIAGLSLARNPIALFLSEGLRFFRDFFLVLFFFTLGARINFLLIQNIWIPLLILVLLILILKPVIFGTAFFLTGEQFRPSKELGIRLGQSSEFSLIIAVVAEGSKIIGSDAAQLIEVAAIATLILNAYLTVSLFPTPLATSSQLKQD